jgi:glutamate racemase
VPLLGVVRPGATAAALATRTRHLAVIATPATVRSGAYHRAIVEEDARISVIEHATPDLVPLVESGRLEGPDVRGVVAASLAPALDGARGPVDTLLLGCTHYPLLEPVIRGVAGPAIAVIDSATATASALAALLEVDGIEAPATTRPARHLQLTTGDVAAFERTARLLFGDAFPEVEGVAIVAPRDPVAIAVLP